MSDSVPFDPLILQIGKDLGETDGRLLLSQENHDAWAARLRSCPEQRRKSLGAQLIVLAERLQAQFGAKADFAVLQLADLLSMLLGSLARSVEAFDRQGVQLRKAAASIGLAKDADPSGRQAPPEGAMRLLDFLVKNRT